MLNDLSKYKFWNNLLYIWIAKFTIEIYFETLFLLYHTLYIHTYRQAGMQADRQADRQTFLNTCTDINAYITINFRSTWKINNTLLGRTYIYFAEDKFTWGTGYFMGDMKTPIKTLMKTPIEKMQIKFSEKISQSILSQKAGESDKLLGASTSSMRV